MEHAISTVKIGLNKGQSRLWLENATLAKYGFNRHDSISIHFNNALQTIHITRTPGAPYRVAGRVRRGKNISIIDINSSQLTKLTNGATTARVTYTPNRILIEVLNND
jgi:hypothetical protein